MGDLEEVISRKFLLIDTWDVRHQHFLIAGFSVLMFATYSAFMWILCSMTLNITTSLLLLGSQIGIGLPITRAFYDWGVTSRGMLKLYDSGLLGNDLETTDLRINTGDIPLVFEQLEFQIRKYDSEGFDDLNDLVWFAIVVWAVISSAGIFPYVVGIPICVLGAVVLLLACFVSYVSGYRTNQGVSFEEDINHLEYYIERCIKTLDAALPMINGKVILQVTKRGRRTVILDIVLEFKLLSDSVIEYHIGLSSERLQRFIIVAPTEDLDIAYTKFRNLYAVKEANWKLEQVTTQAGKIVRIVNSECTLCFSDRSSYVINPEHVETNVFAAKETISQIGTILKAL